mgnify:CR=1 FL=1
MSENKKSTLEKSTFDSSNTETETGIKGWKKGRNFSLTVNESSLKDYDKIVEYLKSFKGLNYILVTEHFGQENKHYHIYVQYNNAKKLTFSKMYGAHLEECWSSAQKNIRYLKCEDNKHKKKGITCQIILEEGEPKYKGGYKTIKDIEEMDEEDIKELPAIYTNIAKKIKEEQREEEGFDKMLDEIRNDELKAPEIIYIYGNTGNGKTYNGYKLAVKKYENKDIGRLTFNGGFIDITKPNAKCFVVEEFRPSQIPAADFLQLIDKYGYKCNIKGGFQYLRPECIIICSIKNPYDIYNDEINGQFIRRITKLYKANDHTIEEVDKNIRDLEYEEKE